MSYSRGPGVQHWHNVTPLVVLPGYCRPSGSSVAVWPSANLAIYVPVVVGTPSTVRRLWFGSGSTGTGNVDMALYNAAGVSVVGAATAAKEASATLQSLDVTDTFIGPGVYYIGLSSDSGTDTFARSNAAAPLAYSAGLLTEASAYPLPSTATWAASQSLAYVPLVGLLVEATAT